MTPALPTDEELAERLAPHLHVPYTTWSFFPIEQSVAQLFCAAVEDRNPVYWDAEVAAGSRFGRIIAPPQFLMAANVPPPWIPDYVRDALDAQASRSPEAQARAVLAEYGFTTVTVVNRVDEYLAPFGQGDGRIRRDRQVVSVSPIKQTKVGRGVFFTYEMDFFRERDGEQIGRSRNVTLIYRPEELA